MADTPLLSWEASEFKHYPKNMAWYLTLGIIVALIIAFQVIFQKDYFGAISLGIIAIFIFIFAMHRPGKIQISLSSEGLHMEKSFIPYSQMKYFWIVNNDDHKTLNIETTAYINRTILVELEAQDPNEVREILLSQVAEHSSTEETPIQRLIHRLKF